MPQYIKDKFLGVDLIIGFNDKEGLNTNMKHYEFANANYIILTRV